MLQVVPLVFHSNPIVSVVSAVGIIIVAFCTYSCIFVKHNYTCRVLVRVCVCACVCACVCVHVCIRVCIFLQDNSKRSLYKDILTHLVCENISDKFDIGHCRTKVKVTAQL